MFDILDDRIKKNDRAEVTPTARWVQRFLVTALSVVLFGALYLGIRALE